MPESRVHRRVAHASPFLVWQLEVLVIWAWPESRSAWEEGLALGGRGGVPIDQELNGDLEGPTSRPNRAETGLDLPRDLRLHPGLLPSPLPLSPSGRGGGSAMTPQPLLFPSAAPSTLNA